VARAAPIYRTTLAKCKTRENLSKCLQNGQKLYAGLNEYFEFYNYKRPYQSLDYHSPNELYKNIYSIAA
jgi:transposase InsO family protein